MILKQFLNLRSFALLLVLFFWSAAGIVQGQQTNDSLDYTNWAATAEMVEKALVDGTSSELLLITLREKLAVRRADFKFAQNVNQTRLDNLTNQLLALGAELEQGTEAVEISARRAELKAQIDTLTVPRVRALEAFKRADGLITEVDILLRVQKTDDLLRLGKTPLDLRIWPDAISELSDRFGVIANGVIEAWNTPSVRAKFRDKIASIVGLFVIVILLVTQGFSWIDRVSATIKRRQDETSHGLATYLRSLVKAGTVFLCFYLLLAAWRISGFYGAQIEHLIENILWSVSPVFVACWIAFRLFPSDENEATPVEVPIHLRNQARLLTQLIGIGLALQFVSYDLQWAGSFGEDTWTANTFFLSLISGASAFRIGQILCTKPIEAVPGSEVRIKHLLQMRSGQVLMFLTSISLLLSVIGYSSASTALLFPSLLSVGLIAGLILTFEAVRDFCAIVAEDSVLGHDSLVAIAINTALLLGSLPVFALIWGARVSNLTEVWTHFKTGIQLGDVQVSPGSLLVLIVVFVIGYLITRIIQRTLKTRILPKTKLDTGGQNAIVSGFGYIGIFVSALIAITFAGLDLSSLAIVAGALSVGCLLYTSPSPRDS